MANLCAGCEINCCIRFGITSELNNPLLYQEQLKQYPYIHPIQAVRVVFNGEGRTAHLHSCGRFDFQTGTCINYDTQPRPPFCLNTGVYSTPHDRCRLTPASL